MSFGVVANILLYASDGSSPLHEKATAFLEQCANGREVFCLAWLTIMSYLRMATHPSIFERPLTHDEAMRNVEAAEPPTLPRDRRGGGLLGHLPQDDR